MRPIDAEELTVENGWLICPYCGNRRLKRIFPDERGTHISMFCRCCKTSLRVNLYKGKVYRDGK